MSTFAILGNVVDYQFVTMSLGAETTGVNVMVVLLLVSIGCLMESIRHSSVYDQDERRSFMSVSKVCFLVFLAVIFLILIKM